MTTEPVGYDAPGTRQRIVECPYCGAQIERGPGGALVAHLPCEATPTTEEVLEGRHGLEHREDAFGNEAAVLEACPHCGHEFDDDGQAVVKHLPCEATPGTDEVFDA